MENPAGSSIANVVDMTRFGADAPVTGSGTSPPWTARVLGSRLFMLSRSQ